MNIIYTKSACEPAQISIFTIPKPFKGHIGLIQFNAIASWQQLTPYVDIYLFGDEAGTKEIAQELGLIHIPEIERNQYGTPLLDSVFAQIGDRTQHNIIAYLNADIILTKDFLMAVQSVDEQLQDYLLIGRRWNIDLHHKLDFNADWQSTLNQLIQEHGYLADYDCKDYFVFPKHLFSKIPRFAVGRGYWDTWMVTNTLANHHPVVDCSLAITAIHQNHPYSHIRGGRNEAYLGREAQINQTLGRVNQPGNIACATWQLKPAEYDHRPQVSVIIVVHSATANIEKAVLSVLIQDYDDYEIILINCGCNQAIEAILPDYINRVKYFNLSGDRQIDAHNYGAKVAQGELITYLDADSVLLPKVLGQQIACFAEEKSTLDILLSGLKVIEQDKFIEYKFCSDTPDLSLTQLNSNNINLLPQKSTIMIRCHRLNLFGDHQNACLMDKISHFILIRRCRAKYLKLITQVQNR